MKSGQFYVGPFAPDMRGRSRIASAVNAEYRPFTAYRPTVQAEPPPEWQRATLCRRAGHRGPRSGVGGPRAGCGGAGAGCGGARAGCGDARTGRGSARARRRGARAGAGVRRAAASPRRRSRPFGAGRAASAARRGAAAPRSRPSQRLEMSRLLCVALLLAGCSKPTPGGVRLKQVDDALGAAGFKIDAFKPTDPGKLSAQKCTEGALDGVETLLCEYGSAEAVALGRARSPIATVPTPTARPSTRSRRPTRKPGSPEAKSVHALLHRGSNAEHGMVLVRAGAAHRRGGRARAPAPTTPGGPDAQTKGEGCDGEDPGSGFSERALL